MSELYDMQDPDTQEWKNGLIALIFNICVECDQPIDQ
jgi:hypothetical protein